MDRFSKSQGFLPGLVEGEVSERFKVLAWKASVGSRPPGVRIPPSPNSSLPDRERPPTDTTSNQPVSPERGRMRTPCSPTSE